MKAVIQKYRQFFSLQEHLFFLKFLGLGPSIEMAITPTFFEQIEKFLCLKLSTTPGPSHGIPRRHVTRVTCPKTCLEVSQLFCPKSLKTLHV